MVAAIHGGVDHLGDGGPRRAYDTGTDFCVGYAEVAKAIFNTTKGLVDSGDIQGAGLGAGMNNDGFENDEGMTICSLLSGHKTELAKFIPRTSCWFDDYIALTSAGVVVKVAMDYGHGFHVSGGCFGCLFLLKIGICMRGGRGFGR